MYLQQILDQLTNEIIKYEDKVDTVNPDVPSRGSMIADEVGFHLQEGLFNDDLPERIKLIQQMTGYDIGAFIRRYPEDFSGAIFDD
jgi:hypothetical protein